MDLLTMIAAALTSYSVGTLASQQLSLPQTVNLDLRLLAASIVIGVVASLARQYAIRVPARQGRGFDVVRDPSQPTEHSDPD